jgi:2-octaprenyl-6-methoxyphenol hydroxylase
LAILPYKKKNFSLVWSLNKIFFQEKKDNLKKFIESKLNFLFKKKNNFSILNLQFHPIHLSLRKNYHKNNFVILGEGLHSIHPIAGQGFNLIIRDIKKLFEELENNLNLGLPIKNSLILKNFYDIRKPENILISLGIDFTNTFFKKNKLLDPFKNLLLEQVNNNNIKKFSKIISDRGLY